MLIMGIDVGTTNSKVVLYTPDGKLVAKHSALTVEHQDGNGRLHYNPNEIWSHVSQGIKSVLSQISHAGEVASVAVCSAGEALVAIDKYGEAIGQAFPWTDTRTRELGPWWAEHLTENRIYEITGEPFQYKNGINHLLWIRKNQPKIFAAAVMWLHLADFVAFKLAGEAITNYSIAGPSMMFDNAACDWSDEILKAAGIDRSVLTPLAPSGTLLGAVCSRAAKETGLTLQTKVSVGGHDHITAALACNLIAPGDCLNSMGTGECVIEVLDKLLPLEKVIVAGVIQHCHVVKDRYYVAGSLVNGSGVIDWAMEHLDFGENFENNIGLANAAPLGCNGVFFLPHLRGCVSPAPDEYSRGAFVGLREKHTKNDLLRAVHEGLAYELRAVINKMDELTGFNTKEVVGIGGGFRNFLMRQLKANVTGKEFVLPEIEEAASLGAAFLGGLGAGVYQHYQEISERMQRVERRVVPDSRNAELYNDLFQKIYRQMHSALKPLNHAISQYFEGHENGNEHA